MSLLKYASEHRGPVIVAGAGVAIACVLAFALLHAPHETPPPPPHDVTMVMIKPPPPPPPPPPVPQQKTIVPQKITVPTPRPMAPTPTPPKPSPSPAPSHLGTSIKGAGPDAFNLSGSGNGLDPFGNGTGDGTGGGPYEAAIAADIQNALLKNPVTRSATGDFILRIWIDASGRVTQVQIDQGSNDPTLDNAVKNVVLATKLYPLPAGKQPPVRLHFNAQAPLS